MNRHLPLFFPLSSVCGFTTRAAPESADYIVGTPLRYSPDSSSGTLCSFRKEIPKNFKSYNINEVIIPPQKYVFLHKQAVLRAK